jgi:hypothetical protein
MGPVQVHKKYVALCMSCACGYNSELKMLVSPLPTLLRHWYVSALVEIDWAVESHLPQLLPGVLILANWFWIVAGFPHQLNSLPQTQ